MCVCVCVCVCVLAAIALNTTEGQCLEQNNTSYENMSTTFQTKGMCIVRNNLMKITT